MLILAVYVHPHVDPGSKADADFGSQAYVLMLILAVQAYVDPTLESHQHCSIAVRTLTLTLTLMLTLRSNANTDTNPKM